MRWGVLSILCWMIFTDQALASSAGEFSGEVAYTEIMRFDYDKDGRIDSVQFWAEFQGRPAIGTPGDASHKSEEGDLFIYLYDVERKRRIADWLQFSMAALPPNKPFPMTSIEIKGKTASFKANGVQYTVIDGGKGYRHDRVIADDGFHERELRLYDGEIRVSPGR